MTAVMHYHGKEIKVDGILEPECECGSKDFNVIDSSKQYLECRKCQKVVDDNNNIKDMDAYKEDLGVQLPDNIIDENLDLFTFYVIFEANINSFVSKEGPLTKDFRNAMYFKTRFEAENALRQWISANVDNPIALFLELKVRKVGAFLFPA